MFNEVSSKEAIIKLSMTLTRAKDHQNVFCLSFKVSHPIPDQLELKKLSKRLLFLSLLKLVYSVAINTQQALQRPIRR